MLGMNVTITPDAIAGLCKSAAASGIAIEVVDRTGSTNSDLLVRAGHADPAQRLSSPTLRVARVQDAGRGRAGRVWQSDAASLTFSLAWSFDLPVAALVGLPLACGVAVAEVLAARGVAVALKWPNDILHAGRKLGGILIETTHAATAPTDSGQTWAVIGIGINLRDDGAAEPAVAGAFSAAALPATDRNRLMAELLDALAAMLQQFAAGGFATFVPRWNALHAHAGQAVDILDRGSRVAGGIALGVDATGRLLLQTAAGPVAVMAGDVSLRPVEEGCHAAPD